MTTDIQIFLQKSGLNFLLKHRESKEYRLIQRYRILQLNRFGMNGDICSWYVGCHKATVNRWIKRIQSGGELQDRKRSGRPPIFKEDIMIRTISFYCQISPLGGCSSWSLRLAANYLREHPRDSWVFYELFEYSSDPEQAFFTSSPLEILSSHYRSGIF